MHNELPGVTFTFEFNGLTVETSLRELLANAMNIHERPDTVKVSLSQDGVSLVASMSPLEADYPYIAVDAKDRAGEDIYLACAELPNESYPDAVTTRLYAGYGAFETDEPIALVKTGLRGQEEIKDLEEKTLGTGIRKIVNVDTDHAFPQAWTAADAPEHFGDVPEKS